MAAKNLSPPPIKVARVDDAAAMAFLHGRCFDSAWNKETFSVLLTAEGGFGVICGGSLASGLAVGRVTVDEAEILTLAVAPRVRGRGLGGRLLDAALACAAHRGAKRMVLEVAEDNGAARRLYERAGFAFVGRRCGYYWRSDGNPMDALTLERGLGD